MDTIYCKLYTKSEKNYNSLLEFLQSSKFCNSCEFNIGIIQSDCFEMELIKNKDIVGTEVKVKVTEAKTWFIVGELCDE